MLDARGEMKVDALIVTSNAHFLVVVKICELFGSDWLSQPMIPLLRSVSGNIWLAGGSVIISDDPFSESVFPDTFSCLLLEAKTKPDSGWCVVFMLLQVYVI